MIGLGALLAVAVQSGDSVLLSPFTIYGVTLVLLFTMSTLYQSFHRPRLKALLKLFDHVVIYILIAGSYTPFMIVSLGTMNGWLILGFVWSLAVVGILSEVFLKSRTTKIIQLFIYLGMGWARSLDLTVLKTALGTAGFSWVVLGGLAYTSGIIF